MIKKYKTKEEVSKRAYEIHHKNLSEFLSKESIKEIEEKISLYSLRRKGLMGNIIERYFFNINPGNISEPDFTDAGIELKTTPLKRHKKKELVAKERLVFSQINYDNIVREDWENSTFLKKNKLLLLMFYVWEENKDILDYRFEFIHFLNLLDDISEADALQIKRDWEYIVAKIKRGEAHLLSEGDTYYLGACTKAADSTVVRDQPMNHIPAKPRAFSFKKQYLNYLIQTELLHNKIDIDSIYKKQKQIGTIEDVIKNKFNLFIGKSDRQILVDLKIDLSKKSKDYKRLLVNRIFGVNSKKILELEKADITLKVITLEPTGSLKESISFPAFKYKELIAQDWYNRTEGKMSDFHAQLESKKFLFVIFQKQKDSKDIFLKKILFWNFPMKDIEEAKRVWEKTVDCIKNAKYNKLPKMKDSPIVHIRPHGRNAKDTQETPQMTYEIKRSFWLNAKYIQKAIEKGKN